MQTTIAVILFALLKIFDSLLYRTCFILLFPIAICWQCTAILPQEKPDEIMESVDRAQIWLRRYQPAVKSATVEFHKAQCFFILAIDIAGLIVVGQGSLDDGTLQSLNNYSLVGFISTNGVLPVVLILLCLHTVGMHSWYVLVLSTCTIVLSTVTFFMSGILASWTQGVGAIQAASNNTYSLCGKKDPSRFCTTADWSVPISSTGHAGGIEGRGVIFSLVILVLLILEYGGLQEIQSVQRFLKRFPDHVNVLSNLVYLFIWIWYCVSLHSFLVDLRSWTPTYGWTFGQIVAIMVWAAPIFEFIKLLVREFTSTLSKPTRLTIMYRGTRSWSGLPYSDPLQNTRSGKSQ